MTSPEKGFNARSEVRGAAMLGSASASSILFRLALGKPGLAQAFDDALVLRLVGRIIARMGSATQAGSSFDRVASFTMRSPPTRGKQRLPQSDFMRRLHFERTFRLDSLRGRAQNRREMEKTLIRAIFDYFNVIKIIFNVIKSII